MTDLPMRREPEPAQRRALARAGADRAAPQRRPSPCARVITRSSATRLAAQRRDLLRRPQLPQRRHGRAHHVVRVVRADALGEHVGAARRARRPRARRRRRSRRCRPTPGAAAPRPAPKWPMTSYGIVPSMSGTSTMPFLACSMPLRIASGTSFALPRPKPTRPLLSPTTTSALKLKRRPPFTTLATRLMWTTFSFSSVPRSSTIRRWLLDPSAPCRVPSELRGRPRGRPRRPRARGRGRGSRCGRRRPA